MPAARHTTGGVATLKADTQAWRATGAGTEKPSLRALRKRLFSGAADRTSSRAIELDLPGITTPTSITRPK